MTRYFVDAVGLGRPSLWLAPVPEKTNTSPTPRVTVRLSELVSLPPGVVTVTGPSVASWSTTTVICVAVTLVALVADSGLAKVTVFSPAVAAKLEPVMVMVSPGAALVVLRLVTTGGSPGGGPLPPSSPHAIPIKTHNPAMIRFARMWSLLAPVSMLLLTLLHRLPGGKPGLPRARPRHGSCTIPAAYSVCAFWFPDRGRFYARSTSNSRDRQQ